MPQPRAGQGRFAAGVTRADDHQVITARQICTGRIECLCQVHHVHSRSLHPHRIGSLADTET